MHINETWQNLSSWLLIWCIGIDLWDSSSLFCRSHVQCIFAYDNKLAKLTNLTKIELCIKTVLDKTVVAGHVHGSITLCSSGVKRCSWSLWKADMMPFNFDVHGWYWFILDHGEKCLYFLLFSLIFIGRILTRCWKLQLLIMNFNNP